jgi:hypothetical protein
MAPDARARRAAGVVAAIVLASGVGACVPAPAAPKIAFFERDGAPREIVSNYYPLKVAARAGIVAVLDSSSRLGFKSSRVLVLDAKTGALVYQYAVPRATGRGGAATAVDIDASGRIYVAVDGALGIHVLRLSRDAAAPRRPAAASPRAGESTSASPQASTRPRSPAPAPARYTDEWDFIRRGKYPAGLRVGANDELVLVDGGNHRIVRIGWKGADPRVIGSSRDLDTPRGAALLPDGSICAKNGVPAAPAIACYDRAGMTRARFVLAGLAEPLEWFYNDVALGPDGKLYVTDYEKHMVRVFSQTGAPLGQIADPALKGPMGIAFDESANLYVADAWAKHLLRFRPVYEKEAAERARARAKEK